MSEFKFHFSVFTNIILVMESCLSSKNGTWIPFDLHCLQHNCYVRPSKRHCWLSFQSPNLRQSTLLSCVQKHYVPDTILNLNYLLGRSELRYYDFHLYLVDILRLEFHNWNLHRCHLYFDKSSGIHYSKNYIKSLSHKLVASSYVFWYLIGMTRISTIIGVFLPYFVYSFDQCNEKTSGIFNNRLKSWEPCHHAAQLVVSFDRILACFGVGNCLHHHMGHVKTIVSDIAKHICQPSGFILIKTYIFERHYT